MLRGLESGGEAGVILVGATPRPLLPGALAQSAGAARRAGESSAHL